MSSADHIPFSSKDEGQIRSLTNWMGAVGVVHFLGGLFYGLFGLVTLAGAAGLFTLSAFAGIVAGLVGLGTLVLTLLMFGEGGLIFVARAKFIGAIEDVSRARPQVAAGMRFLKYLFLCELAWFGGSGLIAVLNVALFFATPEQTDFGQQMGDLVRQFGGQQ